MKQKQTGKDPTIIKPDPETLHTTDPQEKMKGPMSTPIHELEKIFDVAESKKSAEKKKGHSNS
ncbi:MAG: hypothetical protein J7539_04405 [Niabella sp.]|nr:hypothetical protein [Niabella sp.]